ncbi:MAG: hypothetical protein D6767_07380, partial [Candidatus Hydrogenedentota bacterium]
WVGMDTTDIRTSIEGEGGKYRFPDQPIDAPGAEKKIQYIYASTRDIEGVLRNLKRDPIYGSWFPSPAVYNISTLAGQGANQQRPLGRLAFFQNFETIRKTLIAERDYLLSLSNDPKYFELMDQISVNGKLSARITIFMTGSVMGGTCSGSFLDMAALIRDLFQGIPHKMYGIYVLPQAFEKVVDNPRARANAYAALKELDYFMSGNEFEAVYPGGYKIHVRGNLFKNGRVYLLDRTNMQGHSVQDRDQVQQITSQMIYHFVASNVGGKIEERLVNLSDITAVYFPKRHGDEDRIIPRRRAAYNSFGISRAVYPVPELKKIGLATITQKILRLFLRAANMQMVRQVLGDLNRGLFSDLRLHPRILFDKLFPDFQEEFKLEFKPLKRKLNENISRKKYKKVFEVLEIAYQDYKDTTKLTHKIRTKILNKYAKREWNRVEPIIRSAFLEIIQDQNRGFRFAEEIKNKIEKRIKSIREVFYNNLVKIVKYPDDALRSHLRKLEAKKGKDLTIAKELLSMIRFNFEQSFYQGMLEAAVTFCDNYLDNLNLLYQKEVQALRDKLEKMDELLSFEIRENTFEITEKQNPVFQYLVSKNDIDKFVDVYFENRLGIEELAREVKFYEMDKADDLLQDEVIARFGAHGKKALEEDDLLGSAEEKKLKSEMIEARIFKRSQELMAEVLTLKEKLYQKVLSRYENFDFESISIKEALKAKGKTVKEIITELDKYSSPYIQVNPDGIECIELFRTVSNFELSDYEVGDEPKDQDNDLPPRLDHFKKRSMSKPPVRAEMFTAPQVVKPYELKTMGLLLSFPLFSITSLQRACEDYHNVYLERSHPLHLFNGAQLNAAYFPDPFRERNYMNPVKVWKALVLFKLLIPVNGVYKWLPQLQPQMKAFFYRNKMKSKVDAFIKESLAGEGLSKQSADTLWQAAVLTRVVFKAKNGKWYFDRKLIFQVKDIFDKNTAQNAMAAGKTYREYVQSLPEPVIATKDDWQKMLNDNEFHTFITKTLEEILTETQKKLTEGVDLEVPPSALASIPDLGFKDHYAFFAFVEKQASVEVMEFIKAAITTRIFAYLESAKFRLESDPTIRDIEKIGNFLEERRQAIPECILFDLKAYYGIG